MKHFKLLKSKVDVDPFLKELENETPEWSVLRGQMISCQRETVNIWLRKGVPAPGKVPNDIQETKRTEHYTKFPLLTRFLEKFAESISGELGRTMIVKLRENGTVYPHYDEGLYYTLHDRYHLVLKSEGSKMVSGNDIQIFKEGELWWFDNKAEHIALNESNAPRIHVIFDIVPTGILKRIKNYLKRHRADVFGYELLPSEVRRRFLK